MNQSIEHLNADCTCVTLDHDALCHAFLDAVGDAEFCRRLAETHPNLISAQPLFLSRVHADEMQLIVRTIEMIATLPTYRETVVSRAGEMARFRPGPAGVFMGYDFHLGPDGPRLIEINTNAGGALINVFLAQAQHSCCREMGIAVPPATNREALTARFVDTFREDWQRQGHSDSPASIAIVDDDPTRQYLYPEFRLFERLFEKHGIAALIADPTALQNRDHGLWIGARRVDLVYNRLTDFDLSQPAHEALRAAYLAGNAVVTPNPWSHAHLADKRNLVTLSDASQMEAWDVGADVATLLLRGIPRTVLVTPASASDLWAHRNALFFKPCAGYGSKAAYRGDKITHKVWGEILSASYVAQDIVQPSARAIAIDGRIVRLKVDLRCYTYAGDVLLIAARLYRGQTTNFRTSGGGFAPVIVGESDDCTCSA